MTDVSEAWIIRDLSFGEVRAVIASRRRDNDRNLYIWTEAWADWKNLEDPETYSFKATRRETQKPPALPLVAFLINEVTNGPKASAKLVDTRPAQQRPTPPVPEAKKPAPKKTTAPSLMSLKTDGPRKRTKDTSILSMDDIVESLIDKEPQTLEPITPHRTSPPARVPAQNAAGKRRYVRYGVNLTVKIITNIHKFSSVTRDISEGGIRLADPLPEDFAGYCQVVLQPANNPPFHLLCALVEDQEDGKYHLEFVESENQAAYIAWLRRQKWAAA